MKAGTGGVGGRGRFIIPSEDEVEVVEILVTLKKYVAKSELLSRYSFTWGRKKKRSVLVSKSESSESTHRKIEKKAASVEADKSPSTPLCFLPSTSGSDGANKPKQQQSYPKKNSKKRTAEDLMGKLDALTQEREILTRETTAMRNFHQELTAKNLELKAKRHEIICSRNSENFQLWKNTMKQQQQYHQQISIFTPPQQRCQPFMVDLQPISCSNNNGGRLGLFNQMAPRVKIHGETFDFMKNPFQPLDQNVDNDLRVRAAAAAARRRRRMKRKESRSLLLAMKVASKAP